MAIRPGQSRGMQILDAGWETRLLRGARRIWSRQGVVLVLFCLLAVVALPPCGAAQDSFTPAGATRIDVTVAGDTGFLFKPTQGGGGPGAPWVWYAPTLLRESPALPNASTHWLFSRLLARGIWIAGIDIGESYGAPPGRAVYSKFYRALTSKFQLSGKPCFLVQSRGGLMGFSWAEEHPGEVRCMAGIYPALNLASWPRRDPARYREAAAAYGYKSLAEFQKQLIPLSPISHLAPLAEAKIPVFILHGDSDQIVPMPENSGRLVTAYRALGGSVHLTVVPGRGHEEVDEYFHSSALLNFLIRQLVKPAAP